jgi:phosphate transport system protein
MNRYFYSEIENLRSRLILMAERATEVFKMAVSGLIEEDIARCETVLRMDDEIDALDKEIGHEAVRYISLRSPIARDLRMMMVAIKTAANLERIGDEATSIAKRSRRILGQGKLRVDLLNIADMLRLSLHMMEEVKDLFLNPDPESAMRICAMDREIDQCNSDNLQSYILQAQQPGAPVGSLFELAMISKAIERVADHVTNIAETIVYLEKGEEAALR